MNEHKIFYLEIIDSCNLRCSYCYNNSRPKHRPISLNDFKKFCSYIKTVTCNVEVVLLGGEPSVHRHIFQFIADLCKLHNVIRVRLMTNGIKTINGYFSSKVSFTMSLHPTANYNKFLENLKKYSTHNTVEVTILDGCDLTNTTIKHIFNFLNMHNIFYKIKKTWFANKEYTGFENDICGFLVFDDETAFTVSEIFIRKKIKLWPSKCKMNTFFIDTLGNMTDCKNIKVCNVFKDHTSFKEIFRFCFRGCTSARFSDENVIIKIK